VVQLTIRHQHQKAEMGQWSTNQRGTGRASRARSMGRSNLGVSAFSVAEPEDGAARLERRPLLV
jgi:hypothetical protein